MSDKLLRILCWILFIMSALLFSVIVAQKVESKLGYSTNNYYPYNYCPYCGADIKEGE